MFEYGERSKIVVVVVAIAVFIFYISLRPRPLVSTLFRDPQALSSTLAVLGTLQPLAFGSLNRVETSDSASNYYLVTIYK